MTTYSVAYGVGQLFTVRIAIVLTASSGLVLFTIISSLTATANQFISTRLPAETARVPKNDDSRKDGRWKTDC